MPALLYAIIHSVNINQSALQTRYFWLKKPLNGHLYGQWLIDTGSLTARLQRRYAQFSVKPITVRYAKPIQDEAVLLQQPVYKTALVREVLLLGDNQAVVFAHSVLPRASLRGAWHGLGKLGNKPLGATLFANQQVKRTPLCYKKLSPHHSLYQHAAAHLAHKPAFLWARRSMFSLKFANIMVTEVFLPAIHTQ
jgi:chorismate--pyruvate lyase